MENQKTEQTTDQKREKALNDAKMYMANDWELDSETPEYFLLKKNTGKAWVHIVYILTYSYFFLFIPNLMYYKRNKKTKKIMK